MAFAAWPVRRYDGRRAASARRPNARRRADEPDGKIRRQNRRALRKARLHSAIAGADEADYDAERSAADALRIRHGQPAMYNAVNAE